MAELLGRQNNVGFQYYGDRLIRSRKLLHGSLNATAVGTTWAQLLQEQSSQLLRRFKTSPKTFYDDVEQYVLPLECVMALIILYNPASSKN